MPRIISRVLTAKAEKRLVERRTDIRQFAGAEIYLFNIAFYLFVREIPPTN
jgi:hypothetical protein